MKSMDTSSQALSGKGKGLNNSGGATDSSLFFWQTAKLTLFNSLACIILHARPPEREFDLLQGVVVARLSLSRFGLMILKKDFAKVRSTIQESPSFIKLYSFQLLVLGGGQSSHCQPFSVTLESKESVSSYPSPSLAMLAQLLRLLYSWGRLRYLPPSHSSLREHLPLCSPLLSCFPQLNRI